MLASDINLSFIAPNFLLMTHIQASNDNVDLIGASFPFLPSVVSGRSRTTAWGFTNSFTDTQDLFVINPFNQTHYDVGSGMYSPFTYRVEVVSVRGSYPYVLRVIGTSFGPIINFVSGVDTLAPISLYWPAIRSTASDPDKSVISMCFGIPLATTAAGFSTGGANQKAPALNYVFADYLNDNIAYQLVGRHMIRRIGHSGRFPVAGILANQYTGSFNLFFIFFEIFVFFLKINLINLNKKCINNE